MDEGVAIVRARRLCRELTIEQIRVPLRDYVKAITALPDSILLRFDDTLDDDASGHTVKVAGKHCIVLNANHSEERQRFTACHEIGHIVLEVATEHDQTGDAFVRRSQNEVFCDVFAAEMLLPKTLLAPLVEEADIGFASIERLSRVFGASLTATGSRFAELCDRPCAFVLINNGTIRYAARSRSMKDCGAWLVPGSNAPESSLASQQRARKPAQPWLTRWTGSTTGSAAGVWSKRFGTRRNGTRLSPCFGLTMTAFRTRRRSMAMMGNMTT